MINVLYSAILLIISISFVLYVGLGVPNLGSFAENLLTEAMGVAITVIIVERLIRYQRREELHPVRSDAYRWIADHLGNIVE